jgi:CubicO group peptidase (beta-lactamase class C family)
MRGFLTRVGSAALVLFLAGSIGPLESPPRALADDAARPVVAKYRERIPTLMAEEDVPGLAVAVVDRDRTLWVEGFGRLDRDGSAAVNADTVFSVQSMSKLFTATAVMQAVASGRLDLDEPITTYLPRFTVHSAFEEHPERKITLRMLLSHTAGFTHGRRSGTTTSSTPATSTTTSAASPTPGCASRSGPGTHTRTSGSTSPGRSSRESRASRSRT